MQLELSPRRVLMVLFGTICFLVVASSLGIAWFINYPPVDYMPMLVNLFNLNLESNIPAFYSSLQLIVASALLFSIGGSHKKSAQPWVLWYVLAAIFVFLAVDEFASIHESLTDHVRESLGTSGYLFYAWVIPYGIAVLLLGLLFARFLLRLPRATMIWFMVSGTTFIAGAVGFEMLGGNYVTSPDAREVVYSLLYTCEEMLEMVGIALFIYALMTYITREFRHMSYVIRE